MDAATLTQVVTALTVFAKIVDSLGAGGLVALALAGPVVVVLAVMILSHLNGAKLAKIIESYRDDADRRFDEYRKDADRRFDHFRDTVTDTLTQLSQAHAETAQFYRDNVELVKIANKLAEGFQDTVVSNTAALERVANMVRHNQYCPVARRDSGGE